jgi:hypothetical protein
MANDQPKAWNDLTTLEKKLVAQSFRNVLANSRFWGDPLNSEGGRVKAHFTYTQGNRFYIVNVYPYTRTPQATIYDDYRWMSWSIHSYTLLHPLNIFLGSNVVSVKEFCETINVSVPYIPLFKRWIDKDSHYTQYADYPVPNDLILKYNAIAETVGPAYANLKKEHDCQESIEFLWNGVGHLDLEGQEDLDVDTGGDLIWAGP